MRLRSFLPITAIAVAGVLYFLAPPSFLGGEADAPIQTATLEPQMDEFGVPMGDFNVVDDKIAYGQVFSDLLTPFGVDYQDTVLLAESTKDIFDVRQLKAGRGFRVYTDSLEIARYLAYSLDNTSYVVFDVDEMSATVTEREVQVIVRTVSGTIDQSLFQSLVDQGVHQVVANRMADIYAWQIDFWRLQKGDSYRVVYEDRYAGEDRLEPGRILAARFNHYNKDFYAFRFENGDVDDYYDETGKSIRKAFLMAPVDFSRISSGFSRNRFHPVQKRYKAHLGTDYVADYGAPIVATGDGVVTEARYGQFNGNYVKIRHNATYTTQYLHMSKIKSGIRPGTAVKQNDVIGYVGSTGLATGNHVCYRFWHNGEQINHRTHELPSVGPIPDSYRADFLGLRDSYITGLSAPVDVPIDPSYAMLLRDPSATASP